MDFSCYMFNLILQSAFSLFIKLGLNNYGNRAIAYLRDNKDEMSKEFWNIYCFQVIMAIIVLIAYSVYCIFLSSNKTLSIYLILFVVSSGIDITWLYWGLEEFKITVTRSFVIKILSTIAIFIFIKDEGDTGLYTLILSIGFLGSQILLWPRLLSYVNYVRPTITEVKKHIRPNLVLFLPAIAVSFYKIMDKIMLGVLSSTTEVGYYESSEKIIKVPMAVIESLGTVMQPRMSNLVSSKASDQHMQLILKKSILVTMFFSTTIGFGIMSLADEFVPFFYGAGFNKCSALFKILLPSCMFLALTNVFKTQYLLPQKKDSEYIVALFVGAAINLLMNSLLIPRLDSVGAAIGTLAAEIAVCIVIGFLVNKELCIIKYYSLAAPFVGAGLIMFIIGSFLPIFDKPIILGFGVKILICSVIYIIILLIEIIIGKLSKKDFFDLSRSVISEVIFSRKKWK